MAKKTEKPSEDVVEEEVVEETAEPPEQELEDHHDVDHPIDETDGSSLASKVLTGLVLLIAGGALALWGGPKLVPYVPAGMEPVARFLTPGDFSKSDEITSLQQEVASLSQALEQAGQKEDLAALRQETDQKFTALQDKLNATDGEAIEARLAEAETKLAGVAAQVGSLTESLSGVQANTEGLSSEAASQISAYKAQIEGLMAEISTLSSKQGSLAQKIDDVSVASERKVAEAEEEMEAVIETAETQVASAEVKRGLASLSKALETGAALSEPLNILQVAGVEVPETLAGVAETGVPTLASLKSSFSGAAHAALKASIKADASEGGFGTKIGSFLRSQVTVRSLEPKEGDDADAILSRVQGHLDSDALDAAVSEAQNLGEASQTALSDWLSNATTRVDALGALTELQTQFGN